MSFEDAVKQAKALLEPYRPEHPRVEVWVGFEVKLVTCECLHVEEPKEALEAAQFEDKQAVWEEENTKELLC